MFDKLYSEQKHVCIPYAYAILLRRILWQRNALIILYSREHGKKGIQTEHFAILPHLCIK